MQNYFYDYLKNKRGKCNCFVTQTLKEAHSLYEVALYFDLDVVLLPDFRANYGDDLRSYYSEYIELISALNYYYTHDNVVVISPIVTLLGKLPTKKYFKTIELNVDDDIKSIDTLKDRLYNMGYSFVSMVEVEGEVSIRGDIIDIFTPNSTKPYRISLFDTLIEEIKEFDLNTQKSLGEQVKKISILGVSLYMDELEREEILQKIDEYKTDRFEANMESLGYWFIKDRELLFDNVVSFSNLSSHIDELYSFSNSYINPKEIKIEQYSGGNYKELSQVENINDFLSLHSDKKITLIAKNESLTRHIEADLSSVKIVKKDVNFGVISPDEVVLSLNSKVERRKKRSKIMLDDLKIGDYVVHNDYGIGIFSKMTQIKIEGSVQDFIEIKYSGEGNNILLPVSNLSAIDRYIFSSDGVPVLDSIGKGSFKKLKEKVKEDLLRIAQSIVNTAAKRELIDAPKLKIEKDILKTFQDTSGFTYTIDQQNAISKIKEELQLGHPMDMLLVGDVGFGKTEVAMNAIYTAIMSGYQVALIVPTTLLSMQHYTTLSHRYRDVFKVLRYDKFVSSKDKKTASAGLADGSIDLVVGTHSIYSLKFAKLGLVIIDEEHRFGVVHKEKLKDAYYGVHQLSMSATPIPRSLNLALSSLKTISYLQTPPKERVGVRTFLKEYSGELIKEIINRELRRGGQLFYIFNSIASIENKKDKLEKLYPNLRVAILHSKISSTETDTIMKDFSELKYDLLLCTTIIGAGIHIPTVNSIVIENADRFGIADLHQLRGRVGRNNIEGFCYCIVKDKDELTADAQKRLLALERNSELGSGGVLAQHDLEIRGGGNILGEQQSGKIKNIGYSLYIKMLEEALSICSGNVDNKYSSSVDITLSINSFISSELIGDERLRIELYRRLNNSNSVSEVMEIEEEINDRFGKLDTNTEQFCDIMIMRQLCRELKITKLSNYRQNITVTYSDNKEVYLAADSKDDDDIVNTIMSYLKGNI